VLQFVKLTHVGNCNVPNLSNRGACFGRLRKNLRVSGNRKAALSIIATNFQFKRALADVRAGIPTRDDSDIASRDAG